MRRAIFDVTVDGISMGTVEVNSEGVFNAILELMTAPHMSSSVLTEKVAADESEPKEFVPPKPGDGGWYELRRDTQGALEWVRFIHKEKHQCVSCKQWFNPRKLAGGLCESCDREHGDLVYTQ